MARTTLDDLRGGDAPHNAAALRRLLEGEAGPYREVVRLNAAAGFIVAGRATDLLEGARLAAAALDDGHAARALDRMIAIGQEAAP